MATVTRFVPCPRAAVLGVLADGWTYATWVVGTSRIRAVDPSWPVRGARIEHSIGVWPAVIDDSTIAHRWDELGGRLELRARGWPAGEAHVRIVVVDAPGGCAVTIAEDAVRGPGMLVPRALRTAALRVRNGETLRRLENLSVGRWASTR